MTLLQLLQARLKGLYITQEGLRSLAEYGYHGEDRSFFGNLVLKHWWNWVVEWVPMWFAPNLLTLLGLFCNIAAYLLIVAYSKHLTEAVPRWVCFVCAFCIFAYQTLDNVDGKQARRTGSSTPLGELFDHGCDSITMGMIALVLGAAVRLGAVLTLVGLIVGWGPFYLAHWEEYHTGILIMGKFNGPTEAQLIVMTLLVVTGIAGSRVWLHPLFHINETVFRVNHILFAFSIVFSLITVGQNIYKVLALPTRAMPLGNTAKQLVPFAILIVASAVWAGTEHDLLKQHPHIVMMALSLLFAYLTSRLIVNRVCKEPTQLFHGILVPLLAVTLAGIIAVARDEHHGTKILALILLSLAGAQFLYFSVCVIWQLTRHLNIHAFRIVPNTQQPPPVTTTASPLLEAQHPAIQIDKEAHSIE